MHEQYSGCDSGPFASDEAVDSRTFFCLHNPPLTMEESGSVMPSSGGSKALQMMKNMGFKPGQGLGKSEQGITDPIQLQANLGKRGLGLKLENFANTDEGWDLEQEELLVHEKVDWLINRNKECLKAEDMVNLTVEGPRNEDVVGNSTFCKPEVLEQVFKGKDIFDELDVGELNQARARANPFETIRNLFFMNRAALKMANIDAACDFMFTSKNLEHEKNPVYFADVCAGPGGFTEYILWRKQWGYKGFGLTLKDENDFRVSESTCASSATFQSLYGADDTGDVCNPDNLKHFSERVVHETESGVHFMMSDGGFCVDGQENLQEILSKNIYTCQCLLALTILRPHGHFVTKTFDIFTPFSVGLIYVMYLCFEKVGIIKPNSSRPANSERYFVCCDFKVHPQTNIIREYLWKIAMRLWELRNLPDRDILEIVPSARLKEDSDFFSYIYNSNSSIGRKQIVALKKLAQFCRNPYLVEPRQEDLRKMCLEYWEIPNEKKKPVQIFTVQNLLSELGIDFNFLYMQPKFIYCKEYLEHQIRDIDNWHYTFLHSSEKTKRLNFYAGVGYSKGYRFQCKKWLRIKYLELVKGTFLYGEFVKETCNLKNHEVQTRYSLHVIDAMFLGFMDLRYSPFQERLNLIHKYCKAVNRESQATYTVRVRPKPIYPFPKLLVDSSFATIKDSLSVTLPTMGFNCDSETFEIHSVLLLRTNKKKKCSKKQTFKAKDQLVFPCSNFEELRQIAAGLQGPM